MQAGPVPDRRDTVQRVVLQAGIDVGCLRDALRHERDEQLRSEHHMSVDVRCGGPVLQPDVLHAQDVRGLRRGVRKFFLQRLWRNHHMQLRPGDDLLPGHMLFAVVLVGLDGQGLRLERQLRRHVHGNDLLIERLPMPSG